MSAQLTALCQIPRLHLAWNTVKTKGSVGGIDGIGTRMNYSVFECMLTDIQYRNMCNQLAKIVVKREDWVNIYPICTECYARIHYIPDIKKKEPVKIAVI